MKTILLFQLALISFTSISENRDFKRLEELYESDKISCIYEFFHKPPFKDISCLNLGKTVFGLYYLYAHLLLFSRSVTRL